MAVQENGVLYPFAEKKVADKAAVRKFVQDMGELAERLKDAKSDLKETILSMDEVQNFDKEIKTLKEERKGFIESSSVIQGYQSVVDDVTEERRQLIADAKNDGVPKKEIDAAIKMLKQDIDPSLTSEVYASISDLVD